MQTVSNRQNTNRDCCLHPIRSPLQSQDWTLYSLFKGTAQIITHLHFEQGGEDKRDRDRNRKSGRGNVLLETSLVVYSYWSVYMYLHVLYCCHQKYRDVGKPFLKGLFFSLKTVYSLRLALWCLYARRLMLFAALHQRSSSTHLFRSVHHCWGSFHGSPFCC